MGLTSLAKRKVPFRFLSSGARDEAEMLSRKRRARTSHTLRLRLRRRQAERRPSKG